MGRIIPREIYAKQNRCVTSQCFQVRRPQNVNALDLLQVFTRHRLQPLLESLLNVLSCHQPLMLKYFDSTNVITNEIFKLETTYRIQNTRHNRTATITDEFNPDLLRLRFV